MKTIEDNFIRAGKKKKNGLGTLADIIVKKKNDKKKELNEFGESFDNDEEKDRDVDYDSFGEDDEEESGEEE